MEQVIQNLKQALLNEHIPNEQVQNIISSLDISQINLQDLSATTDYLNQFLLGMGLEENIINTVNTSLAENFGIFGVDSVSDLGVNPEDDILGNLANMVTGFFSGE